MAFHLDVQTCEKCGNLRVRFEASDKLSICDGVPKWIVWGVPKWAPKVWEVCKFLVGSQSESLEGSQSEAGTALRPLRDNSLLQGLVIDDYFAVSVEPKEVDNKESEARRCYDRAQEAYAATDLLGSPAKDVLDLGENSGKIIGAFINSEPSTLARGLCAAGAPPQKRVSLSFITLAMCRLTHTTDVLFLCLLCGWISVLSFRRPLMSILSRSFHLVDQNLVDQNKPQLIKFPRSVASELVLLAVLIPLAVVDLGAEYFERVFCTDASNEMGAICSAPVSREVAQALWRTCRSKGSYTRLLSPAEVVLKRCGVLEEKDPNVPSLSIDRPLACNYDFLEIYAGAAAITRYMDLMRCSCGPPLDLSNSEEFNLMWPHVLVWISCLIASGRLRSFFVSPPCTTFSKMRRPRLRSAEFPLGFDASDPQTKTGAILACRGCQLMYVGAVNDVPGIMETPYPVAAGEEASLCRWDQDWFMSVGEQASQVLQVPWSSCRFGAGEDQMQWWACPCSHTRCFHKSICNLCPRTRWVPGNHLELRNWDQEIQARDWSVHRSWRPWEPAGQWCCCLFGLASRSLLDFHFRFPHQLAWGEQCASFAQEACKVQEADPCGELGWQLCSQGSNIKGKQLFEVPFSSPQKGLCTAGRFGHLPHVALCPNQTQRLWWSYKIYGAKTSSSRPWPWFVGGRRPLQALRTWCFCWMVSPVPKPCRHFQ